MSLHRLRPALLLSASLLAVSPLMVVPQTAHAEAVAPWMDKTLSSDQRVALLLAQMTTEEKRLLVFGYASGDQLTQIDPSVIPGLNTREVVANVIPGSAGYIPGIPRLGIPAQFQTDASMGVRNHLMPRTSLPSSLATAASWDPQVTEAGGRMIGTEARLSGFNIMLAGGINLLREPRNGRNFEYTGEDPLLAAEMGAGLIRGVQSVHVVSTVKHFSINAQETGRTTLSAQISEPALRMSDNLAFELAIERSSPGSVMCSYNKINDVYACENEALLTDTLKRDWGYKGYVMSDWGAVHSTVQAANAGLDQQSGFPFDTQAYFGESLKAALSDGSVPARRLDDMARRILWALIDKGVMDNPVVKGEIDFEAHHRIAQTAAEESLVLLKNDKALLPLLGQKRILLVGSYADKGVLAGGGSSSVSPVGGNAVTGLEPKGWPGPVVWQPSSPLKALQAQLPKARISYLSGDDLNAAARAARSADVVIVFVHQWAGEGFDVSLDLNGQQDELVRAVASANPNTVVVVESGGPVFMPWKDEVRAILSAFYPGARGGEAIARVLSGEVNPSGHLPLTFPASEAQFVHQALPGGDLPPNSSFTVRYTEGAAVGYKWFDLKGYRPLFAFGQGLSYTTFRMDGLKAQAVEGAGERLTIGFTLTNTGAREGKTVGQVYVAAPKSAGWEAPRRLVGFRKLSLSKGQSQTVSLSVDPRLLAVYDEATSEWVIAPGTYEVQLGAASDDIRTRVTVTLAAQRFAARQGKTVP